MNHIFIPLQIHHCLTFHLYQYQQAPTHDQAHQWEALSLREPEKKRSVL